MIAAFLFILGLCAGSFVDAMTGRMQAGRNWINARSQCDHCGHILAPGDLIPLASWLILGGRCRYCRQPITRQHPLIELIGGLVFALSYLLWPQPFSHGQEVLLAGWLVVSVGLLALAVYDVRWMLLPNKILYPTLAVAVLAQLIYFLGYSGDRRYFLINWGLSVLVASGIYLALFIISEGRWIGYGDVRLGLITGTVLHRPSLSFLMIFLASVLGLVAVWPALLTGKKQLSTKLPYGPFLILATFICLLFGPKFIDFYTNSLIR
jgi:prepilin signal peptidase PulO-like enzyme (type II secretory pathway)